MCFFQSNELFIDNPELCRPIQIRIFQKQGEGLILFKNAKKASGMLLLSFLLVLQLILPVGALASTQSGDDLIVWGDVQKVTYDPLWDSILPWASNVMAFGGLNLSTKQLTRNDAEADLVMNIYDDMGANGIIELTGEKLEASTKKPTGKLSNSVKAKSGAVYLLVTHDGSYAKVRVDSILQKRAMLSYVLPKADVRQLTKLSLSKTSLSMDLDTAATLQANAIYSDDSREDVSAVAQWSSSDEDVVTVDAGKVTAVGTGTATITVMYEGKKATAKVTVADSGGNLGELVELQASETEVLLQPSKSLQLQIFAIYDSGEEVDITKDKQTTYRSSSNSVISVKAGLVKAGKKTGKATITVTYQGKKLNIPVNVSKTTVKSLEASADSIQLAIDETEQIELTALFSDGSTKDVTSLAAWTTDNSKVAKVTAGEIIGISSGLAEIKARYGGKEVAITVEVSDDALEPVALEASEKNLKVVKGDEVELQIFAVYEDGSKREVTEDVLWQSQKRSVVNVVAGVLTAVGVGKTTVEATYKGLSVKVNVEVVAEKQVSSVKLSKSSVTLSVGQTAQITATAIYADGTKADVTKKADWSTKRDTIADVSDGLITAVGSGTTTITATIGGKSATISVTVK